MWTETTRRLSTWAVVQLAVATACLAIAMVGQARYRSEVRHVQTTGTVTTAVVTKQDQCFTPHCIPSATVIIALPGRHRTFDVSGAALSTRRDGRRLVTDAWYDASDSSRILLRDAQGKPVVVDGFSPIGTYAELLAAVACLLAVFAATATSDLLRTLAATRLGTHDHLSVEGVKRLRLWSRVPWIPAPHRWLMARRSVHAHTDEGSQITVNYLLPRSAIDLLRTGQRLDMTSRGRAVVLVGTDGTPLGPAGWSRIRP